MGKPVAVIVGAGPGINSAFAQAIARSCMAALAQPLDREVSIR